MVRGSWELYSWSVSMNIASYQEYDQAEDGNDDAEAKAVSDETGESLEIEVHVSSGCRSG